MQRDTINDSVIDLGAASEKTLGKGGVFSDQAIGRPLDGLSDD